MLSESVGEVGRFFRPLAQLHPPLEQLRPMNIRVVQVEGMPILSQDGHKRLLSQSEGIHHSEPKLSYGTNFPSVYEHVLRTIGAVRPTPSKRALRRA